jgi:hypothetical protein
MNPIQIVSILLSITFIAGGAMGQITPPTPKPGPDIMTKGNKSALKKEDVRFIDFRATIKSEDLYSFHFRPSKSKALYYEAIIGTNKIKVDDFILEKIDYEEILWPLATGSQTCTFWKTEDNIYFFKIAGGVGRDDFFGPFRLEGDKFLFAKDLKGGCP